MKKAIGIFALALLLAGCSPNRADGTLVIGGRFFAHQLQDIFMNPQLYMGRAIQHEGVFRIFHEPGTGYDFYAVVREVPSCCGDVPIGIEILLPDGTEPFADWAWVEVTGVLEEHQGFPAIRATLLREGQPRR
ncbi:MAG: hypothetical protein FWC64_10080 [Treponema sp.]|nr:hypothetical protein [Treponema sp.]